MTTAIYVATGLREGGLSLEDISSVSWGGPAGDRRSVSTGARSCGRWLVLALALGAQLGPCLGGLGASPRGPLHGAALASLQPGAWFPRVNDPRDGKRKLLGFKPGPRNGHSTASLLSPTVPAPARICGEGT